MNLSRNQYGYKDPTAEQAIMHIMKQTRSWNHEQSKGLPETGSVVRQ